MTTQFDAATRLTALGSGRYEREIEEGAYWGVVTPHGGYLMALMMAAMELEVGDPARRPRSLVQHFLGRVAPGRIRIEVCLERATRAVTSVSARMYSGSEVAGMAAALFSTDREGPTFLDETMPNVAAAASDAENISTFITPVHRNFDFQRRFGSDAAIVPCEDGGWVLPKERGPWDHRLALLISDLWIPPIVRHPDRVCATPSLHHVVHFGTDVRGAGEEKFLVKHCLTQGGSGMTDEEIGLWSDDGRLLLSARQLRRVVAAESMKFPGN